MRIYIFTILLISMFAILGCEKSADISSPIKYDKQNIQFLYPGNWKIINEAIKDDFRYITLRSKGDAIFIIQIYNKNKALSLNEYVKWFIEQFKKELPVGKVEKSSFTDVDKLMKSGIERGIKENFSLMWNRTATNH